MEPQTIQAIIAIGGGTVVLANVLVFWIREWRKHKTWKANGKDLKLIKDDVNSANTKIDAVDDKLGLTDIQIAQVKTAVNSQKSQCKSTVLRFDQAISKQGQQIVDLAGKK